MSCPHCEALSPSRFLRDCHGCQLRALALQPREQRKKVFSALLSTMSRDEVNTLIESANAVRRKIREKKSNETARPV